MSSKTILDSSQAQKTELDKAHNPQSTSLALTTFRGSKIIEEFEAIGAEADVYLVEKDNKRYFLKLYRRGIKLNDDILKTIQKLSHDHKYFAELFEYGFDESAGRCYELSEYIQHGSLDKVTINSSNVNTLITSLTEALSLLHENQIIHRDLKPNNILLRSIDPLNIVLVDFGVSSVIADDMTKVLTTLKGTYAYTAPEVMSGYIGKEVDYWSLGMILLELLDKNPLIGLDGVVVLHTLATINIDISKKMDTRLQLLLKGLLTRDPKKRWGHGQISDWLEFKTPAVYFDEDLGQAESTKKYKFKNQHYTRKELAKVFLKEENFEHALKHIGRGKITEFLEDIGDVDVSIKLDEEYNTLMEKLVYFIYSQEKELPFSLYGVVIDKEYIINLLIRYFASNTTDNEAKIIKLLKNSTLERLCEIYIEQTNKKLSLFYMIQQFPDGHADLMQYIDINDAIEKNDEERMLLLLSSIKTFDNKTLSLSIATHNSSFISEVLSKTKHINSENINKLLSSGYVNLLIKQLDFNGDINLNSLLSMLLIHGEKIIIKRLFTKKEAIKTTYELLLNYSSNKIANTNLKIDHELILHTYLNLGYSLKEFTNDKTMKNELIDRIIRRDNIKLFKHFEYLFDIESVYKKIIDPSKVNLKSRTPLFHLEGAIVNYLAEKDKKIKKDLLKKKKQVLREVEKEKNNTKRKQGFIKFKTRLGNIFSFYFIFLFLFCIVKVFFWLIFDGDRYDTPGEVKKPICKKMFDYLDGKTEQKPHNDKESLNLILYIVLKPIDMLLGFIFGIFKK